MGSVGSSLLLLTVALGISAAGAADRASTRRNVSKAEPKQLTVEALVQKIKPSVVIVSHFDREGKEDGVGAGFAISSNGLIATSLHVIGEGRAFKIQFPDGTSYDPAEIHAWDRQSDLAVIRINATNVPALPVGDSDELRQGTPVIAIGNPLGLKHSVVQGVVSARRDFDGVEMIQLAIPVEPGNSGGPVLDMQGRVQGLLTMKSAMSANLGFATPVNELRPLLKRPHPMPMDRWIRLSALNTNDWQVLFGAHWTQKSGRITAEMPGTGFGGRSLCLWQRPLSSAPKEIAVTVRLDDEAGAAGLVFGSDGHEKHYGFYPSAGQLRLTRFDGPDVFSWTILEQIPSSHYRKGDWNALRVRHEEGRILCYINDHLVIESEDRGLPPGKVGLAKFRDTRATFKGFRAGANLGDSTELSAAGGVFLTNALEKSVHLDSDAFARLQDTDRQAVQRILHDKAAQFEQRAGELRRAASDLRRKTLQRELVAALEGPEEKVNLFRATLLISKLDNADLDVDSYERQLASMATELQGRLKDITDPKARLNALTRYFFTENGFHGSRTDYYNRANSYLDQVIDEREGLPISLSVLFIELGRRAGIKELAGLPLPGHFMVKYMPNKEEEQFIDVFDEGSTITREQAEEIVRENGGGPLRDEHLKAARKRDIVIRMLRNLSSAAQRSEAALEPTRYLDAVLAISPDSAGDHLDRARLRLGNGDRAGAREDLQWLLDAHPPGIDMERVTDLLNAL